MYRKKIYIGFRTVCLIRHLLRGFGTYFLYLFLEGGILNFGLKRRDSFCSSLESSEKKAKMEEKYDRENFCNFERETQQGNNYSKGKAIPGGRLVKSHFIVN